MVRDRKSKVKVMVLVFAACLVHGVMQGVHDNYGIMMRGLVETSGISYAYISFCIGTGALVYGLAQPFLGILALKKSNAFVILLGIGLTVAGLILTPLCRNRLSMLLFFGLVLPLGTTGLLGMCGDATVPPTSGIINRRFGAEKMVLNREQFCSLVFCANLIYTVTVSKDLKVSLKRRQRKGNNHGIFIHCQRE